MCKKTFTASVYTLGCRVNQYESRKICEYIEARGGEIKSFEDVCDIYIINTCAVTAESERKSRQIARRASKLNPNAKVIMTGCQVQLHPEEAAKIPNVKYVCGNDTKLDAARMAVKLAGGEDVELYGKLEIGTEYENYAVNTPDHTRAYIKIEDGCNNKCAYCVIPKLRGRVRSKPKDDVINEVKHVVSLGYKEIVLTGIETCSYQYGLADLMNKISEIDGLERIRLSSVNPSFINKKFADSIKDLNKVCPHFHLSLQSCCTKTLNSMRRRYNTEMIFKNCEYLREVMPTVCFTADIICGFPGETDEDFKTTLKNTEKLKLLHAHIFPFSIRPGTEAAEMPDQIDEHIKNLRCAELSKVTEKSRMEIVSEFADKQTVLTALFERNYKGYSFGHTENFIPVKVKDDGSLVFKTAKVVITDKNEGKNGFESRLI